MWIIISLYVAEYIIKKNNKKVKKYNGQGWQWVNKHGPHYPVYKIEYWHMTRPVELLGIMYQ